MLYHNDSLAGLSTSILIDFSLTVKAATLIFISGRGSAISFAKEGKTGLTYIQEDLENASGYFCTFLANRIGD